MDNPNKKYHWWKCQQCGLGFDRTTKGEPKQCPLCKDKGVKDYRGYLTSGEKENQKPEAWDSVILKKKNRRREGYV